MQVHEHVVDQTGARPLGDQYAGFRQQLISLGCKTWCRLIRRQSQACGTRRGAQFDPRRVLNQHIKLAGAAAIAQPACTNIAVRAARDFTTVMTKTRQTLIIIRRPRDHTDADLIDARVIARCTAKSDARDRWDRTAAALRSVAAAVVTESGATNRRGNCTADFLNTVSAVGYVGLID